MMRVPAIWGGGGRYFSREALSDRIIVLRRTVGPIVLHTYLLVVNHQLKVYILVDVSYIYMCVCVPRRMSTYKVLQYLKKKMAN